jgi:DNA polymerase I-like protein with 3'-5' exonuclease and polymerase domains
MRTFAQVLLDDVGQSEMAEQFQSNPDFDPHVFFAEHLAQGKWDTLVDSDKKDLRTRSKAANFGFSGALGITTFVTFCKNFGLHLTENDAQRLKTMWFNKYPEVRQYFRNISSRLDPFENTGTVIHRRSNRIRGDCSFTQCANSPFQGMSADGALHALYLVVKECFGATGTESPLFGSRPVLYIHDEIVMETPIDKVHVAGHRLCELMVEGMEMYVPDVPIRASPIAMDRWSKDAEAVFDSSGKLAVWKSDLVKH